MNGLLERIGGLLESVASELIVVALVAVAAKIRSIGRKRRELEMQDIIRAAVDEVRNERNETARRQEEWTNRGFPGSPPSRTNPIAEYMEKEQRKEFRQRQLEALLDKEAARAARPPWWKRLLLVGRAPGLLAGATRAFYHLGLLVIAGLLLLTFGTAGSGSGTVASDITVGLVITGLVCVIPYIFFVLTRAAERRYHRRHPTETETPT